MIFLVVTAVLMVYQRIHTYHTALMSEGKTLTVAVLSEAQINTLSNISTSVATQNQAKGCHLL